MSQTPIAASNEGHAPVAPPQPTGPFKNPAYPQRVHARERSHWQGVLLACERRIEEARKRLGTIGDSPNRATFYRLHAQMLGARDQVAEAARRLPGEVGDLYEEDKHRLEEAVAALDRVFRAWDAL
ncbi:MAG: hypothetical protein AB7I30_09110 [Isosphaeraceae bacterium]